MNYQWSPADLAEYDQYLAGANATLDKLTECLRQLIAEAGEPSAMANMTSSLVRHGDPATLLGLLTAALHRQAVARPDPS